MFATRPKQTRQTRQTRQRNDEHQIDLTQGCYGRLSSACCHHVSSDGVRGYPETLLGKKVDLLDS
jgi:hypothetical protein